MAEDGVAGEESQAAGVVADSPGEAPAATADDGAPAENLPAEGAAAKPPAEEPAAEEGATEGLGTARGDADATLAPAEAAAIDAAASEAEVTQSPRVEEIEVPTAQIDVVADGAAASAAQPARPEGYEAAQASLGRLSGTIEAAMAEFKDELSGLPPGELQDLLTRWTAQLGEHVEGLKHLVDGSGVSNEPPSVPGDPALPSEEGVGRSDLAATGQDSPSSALLSARLAAEEVGSAWADPEDTAKEVNELRRVRRQIRYIFGGMLSSLPDSNMLRVDDLLSDRDEDFQANPKVENFSHTDGLQHAPAVPVDAAPLPQRSPIPEGAQARPRSGATEMSARTHSSMTSGGSAARSEERRKEKKERKHRRHRDRDGEGRMEGIKERDAKRDDGAYPRQWNWAEEVVKASLDPQNQWEFPRADIFANPGQQNQPSWEQPRQGGLLSPGPRGVDIASRARERADEVLRTEREQQQQQRQIFGHT